MKPGVTYYRWMEKDASGELFTPHADPMVYEYPFDYLFYSEEEAYRGLEDMGVVEEYYDGSEDDLGGEFPVPDGWHPDGWVLVTEILELV